MPSRTACSKPAVPTSRASESSASSAASVGGTTRSQPSHRASPAPVQSVASPFQSR